MKTTPDFCININPIHSTELRHNPFQKNKKYRSSSSNIADKIWTPVKYLKLMGFVVAAKNEKDLIENENMFFCKIFSLDSLWAISMQIFLLCIFYKTTEE